MESSCIFCDKYFEKRESVVRTQIGTRLDQMRKDSEQLYSPVMTRLMNAQLNRPLWGRIGLMDTKVR